MANPSVPPRNQKAGKGVPTMAARPRRFSLIYSSDSSLSDVSDDGKRDKRTKKGRKSSNNTYGKQGKLINGRPKVVKPPTSGDDSTESSDYEVIDDGSQEDTSSDDDDDDSDSDASSSDDDNIDFVKLTAQRKKKVMQAYSAHKRGKTATDVINEKKEKKNKDSAAPKKAQPAKPPQTNKLNKNKPASPTKAGSEEDIGEEVPEAKDITSNEISVLPSIGDNKDPLYAATFSDSDDSDYNIDHTSYFSAIKNDDDSIGEIDTGIETGEDDFPILEAEEQNIVKELQEDDNLSFDGSIHEEGDDPADALDNEMISSKYNEAEEDYDDDDNAIMSDFDIPFYEDPKFSNLYYYEDGKEPKLSLSTSLPLILNEEKKNRIQKREDKKRERRERIQMRKQLQKSARSNKSLNIDGGEYSFGAFFHSDTDDEADIRDTSSQNKSSTEGTKHRSKKDQLFEHSDYNSSDSDYDNLLMDIAHMPTDEESIKSAGVRSGVSTPGNIGDALELDSDIDIDEDDDEVSMTNVFIDIDDLDPDSFYFHYSDDDSSLYSHSGSGGDGNADNKDDAIETIEYVDDESTDEDDNIPPPNQRKKNIGAKAKEIVNSNTVGLRPPKLGTWETDNKPFSIIDGLSTKSLYTLIQDHQQLHEQQAQRVQGINTKNIPPVANSGAASPTGEEITLNELLNMSDMDEDEDDDDSSNARANNQAPSMTAGWYNKPAVPLSAFRNKGVDMYDEDDYMIPSLNTKKVPIGYIGGERTRKKIDKMKELQRKRTEKKRLLKKKRKLLKLQRERERAQKDVSSTNADQSTDIFNESAIDDSVADSLPLMDSLNIPLEDANTAHSRKNSVKSVGINEIHEILGKDDSILLDENQAPLNYMNNLDQSNDPLQHSDANILASLTAPVEFDDYGNGSSTLWKQRRQSMVEAAAENLRFTKNGLFSESALADIEGILNNGNSNAFEFNEVLQ